MGAADDRRRHRNRRPSRTRSACCVRHARALAVEDRRLARNPVSGVKAHRREHVARAYLTHGQVAQLADTIDGRYEVVVL